MLKSGIFALIWGAATVTGTVVAAQSLQNNRGPAELPPSSFSGNQYVDSRGCVFIRAGIGGNVRWVPRVSRDRKVICNQRPSAVSRTARVPTQQVTQPTRTVAAPRIVRAAPQVRVAPAASVVSRVQSPTVRYAPAVRTAPTQFRSGNCTNRSSTAQAFTNSGAGVRCGPQAWRPAQATRITQGVAQRQVYGQQVTGHAHTTNGIVLQNQAQRQIAIRSGSPRNTHPRIPAWLGGVVDDGQPYVLAQPPSGYRQVWDDGRINHLRGLRYGATPTSTAWVPPRPRNYGHTGHATNYGTTSYSSRTVIPAPTYQAPAPRVSGGHRYVQVGTFGVAGNAQRTARRLNGMGLPTRITSSGRFNVVLVGPFGDTGALRNALGAARGAGFSDAFTRR